MIATASADDLIASLSSLIRSAVEHHTQSSARSLLTALLTRASTEPSLAPYITESLVPLLAPPSSPSTASPDTPSPILVKAEAKELLEDVIARFHCLLPSSCVLRPLHAPRRPYPTVLGVLFSTSRQC